MSERWREKINKFQTAATATPHRWKTNKQSKQISNNNNDNVQNEFVISDLFVFICVKCLFCISFVRRLYIYTEYKKIPQNINVYAICILYERKKEIETTLTMCVVCPQTLIHACQPHVWTKIDHHGIGTVLCCVTSKDGHDFSTVFILWTAWNDVDYWRWLFWNLKLFFVLLVSFICCFSFEYEDNKHILT